MYYFLYNWIEEHEITKLKNMYICFESGKKTKKEAQKDMNEMQWHKMDYLIFSAMRMRKHHLVCTSGHHNVPYEKQQELNKGLSLEMSALARASAQLLNMLYISTNLGLPHGENI